MGTVDHTPEGVPLKLWFKQGTASWPPAELEIGAGIYSLPSDNLLTLADHALMVEMRDTAAGIEDVPPHEFVDYAAEHSRTLLNYLSIRAMLCGESPEQEDMTDIRIF